MPIRTVLQPGILLLFYTLDDDEAMEELFDGLFVGLHYIIIIMSSHLLHYDGIFITCSRIILLGLMLYCIECNLYECNQKQRHVTSSETM